MPGNKPMFWDATALVVAEILLSLILFATVIGLLVFTIRPHVRKYKPADLRVFERVNLLVSPATNRFMLFITLLGKHQFLIPANLLLIFFFLFINQQTWFSIRVAAIALSSLALMFILKYLFRRKRPLSPLLKAARGLSFPSGHAIMSVTFFGTIIFIVRHSLENNFLRTSIIVLLVALIILIGFSRVYLRVHYASDVIAGFIIGILWLIISLAVLDSLELFFKNSNDTVSYVKTAMVDNYKPPHSGEVARYF
ncbi:MAG TPA: phosphatase PAP2 family protein [Chitinophagaceae bacterium]|nr:phosphatase PAP2 family protein [Chitinophagaceae bacterium]